jgi:hypothetical protein
MYSSRVDGEHYSRHGVPALQLVRQHDGSTRLPTAKSRATVKSRGSGQVPREAHNLESRIVTGDRNQSMLIVGPALIRVANRGAVRFLME